MPSILPALRVLLFASALLPLLLIGGCGLKGDLVLPRPEAASPSQPEVEKDAGDEDSRNREGASE
ncbi:MAG TPA: hypothetical protein VJ908_00340 [Wenzhouxiangellaceae bacterium]|nr:hypothetical protein [Wenzhouxiangellaceae bacterium]